MVQGVAMEKVSGVVEFLKVYKKTWGMAKIKLDDGSTLRCVGKQVAGLKKGISYQLGGHSEVHAEHGHQFEVSTVDGSAVTFSNSYNTTKPRKAAARRMKSAVTSTRGRSRTRSRSPTVPVPEPTPSYSGQPNLQMDRIALAAFTFSNSYCKKHPTVTVADLGKAIFDKLCETLAWKDVSDICEVLANRAAKEAIARVASKKASIGPAQTYADVAIVMCHEAAHHIFLDYKLAGTKLDQEALIEAVYDELKVNAEMHNQIFNEEVARAAATHAVNA